MRYASSRHSSRRLGPSAGVGNRAPSRIACQRARKSGARRSSSAQSASSLSDTGSSPAARVAAIRNLAGRRFSATSRYHESALWIAGSSQILSLAKSLMGRLPSAAFIRQRDDTYCSDRTIRSIAAGYMTLHRSRRVPRRGGPFCTEPWCQHTTGRKGARTGDGATGSGESLLNPRRVSEPRPPVTAALENRWRRHKPHASVFR
jgi:hypothetical protein